MTTDDLRQSGIYCIRNIVSGRRYIGSGKRMDGRKRSHFSLLRKGIHHSRSMQRSWNKHGPTAFTFECLELVDDHTTLIAREQVWIDFYNSADPTIGFNMSPTAGSPLGARWTDEMKAAQSQRMTGKKLAPFSSEHRQRISQSRIGKKYPNLSFAKKGKPNNFTEETRERIRQRNRNRAGYKMTAEQKLKLSKAKTGTKMKFSDETRRKMRDRTIARNKSPEHKAKLRARYLQRIRAGGNQLQFKF